MIKKILVFSLLLFFVLNSSAQDTLPKPILAYKTYTSPRSMRSKIDANPKLGKTIFIGKLTYFKLIFYKKGIWFYSKEHGKDPQKLINYKAMSKYRGKSPRLTSFEFVGDNVYALGELKRKGQRYVLMQELDFEGGELIGKPKAILKQKIRGRKYRRRFNYNILHTPSGEKMGVVYDQTNKKKYKTGDKKYILLDENLKKVGRRNLKLITKSYYGKEYQRTKDAGNFNILEDGSLYLDVSEKFRKKKNVELDGMSLMVYPVDTSLVKEVVLQRNEDRSRKELIGGLAWWFKDSAYSAIGIQYKKESPFKVSQKLVYTNSVNFEGEPISWDTLDCKLEMNTSFDLTYVNINTYVIDKTRVAVVNEYGQQVTYETTYENGKSKTTRKIEYYLKSLNVIGFSEDGEVAWINPIELKTKWLVSNYRVNPYATFTKGDNLFFVGSRSEKKMPFVWKKSIETYKLNTVTGEVVYELNTDKGLPTIKRGSSDLYEQSLSINYKRWFQGWKVYEFYVK